MINVEDPIRQSLLITTMFALLAVTPISSAQSADETAPEESPAEQQSSETDTPPPAPETQDDQSPFDYQSSEEISEDRSVSYPVDI